MSKKTPKGATKKTASAPKLLSPKIWLPLLVGLALILAFARPAWRALDCYINQPEFMNDQQLKLGPDTFKLEEASDPESMQKGLSGRPCMEFNQGMIFDFAKPGQYSFWMKGMRFPIDIIWVDSKKKVVKVEPSVQPSTYPTSYTNKKPAKYVLEMSAGLTRYYGIVPGTTLKF